MALIYAGDLAHDLTVKLSPCMCSYSSGLIPRPSSQRKGRSGEYSIALHYGLAVATQNVKHLKSFAGLQRIGGVLSRSVKV